MPVVTEFGLENGFIGIDFNYCLIAHNSLSDVMNWYMNNSVGHFGKKEEHQSWKIGLFGVSMTHHVYLMSLGCLIPDYGSCTSTSENSPETGIYSWTSYTLYWSKP
jgi:hypothetical protein